MLMKLTIFILLTSVIISCIHTPSYYASLKEETYTHGNTRFSDASLNGETKYGYLVLREDGACSITEIRNGKEYHGGGAWRKTDETNIIRIGLSSNSVMTRYHFFVRVNKETNTYIVSDKLEILIGL